MALRKIEVRFEARDYGTDAETRRIYREFYAARATGGCTHPLSLVQRLHDLCEMVRRNAQTLREAAHGPSLVARTEHEQHTECEVGPIGESHGLNFCVA